MMTRRARGQLFLLRPGPRTDQIIGYIVAVMQKRHGILIHGLCVMSNHWHVCLTDPDGKIVEFERDCHQMIARALNAHHGDVENLWSNRQSNRVEPKMPTDLIRQIAYTMANPVRANAVRYGRHWPGIRGAWPRRPRRFKRPPGFFRKPKNRGKWPDEAFLEMSRPPGFDNLTDDELAAMIKRATTELEDEARATRDAEKRPFLGRRKVLAQSRYYSPDTKEPRFKLNPRIACRDKQKRIERLARDKLWQNQYQAARQAWCAGDRDVIWPAGTYLMHRLHNVNCAPAPT